MKRALMIGLVAMLMASPAMSQQFFVSGGVSTTFDSEPMPEVALGVSLQHLDIEAGVAIESLGTLDAENLTNDAKYDEKSYWVVPFLLVSPKVELSERAVLLFPIGVSVSIGSYEYDQSWAYSATEITLTERDTLRITGLVGARLQYSFTDHWSVFGGASIDLVQWQKQTETQTYNAGSYDRENKSLDWLSSGRVNLGVRYTF
jgi:hypothetical protein